jgi:hypothetical protein
MREGWQGEDYLILFKGSEISEFTLQYDLATYLPGYEVVGLTGWDDFLLRNGQRILFTIPTVPIDPRYLAPTARAIDGQELAPDEGFRGKVKWHKNPLVFGGSPTAQDNVCWIPLDQHPQLVKFWNKTYRSVAQT